MNNCCPTNLAAKFNNCDQMVFVQGVNLTFSCVLFNPISAQPKDLTGAIIGMNFPRQGGGVIKRTNGPVAIPSAAVIIPQGGPPGYILLPDHGLVTGDKGELSTSGVLPSPLATLTDYLVLVIDNNSFYFTDLNGAIIDITDQGSGGFAFTNSIDLTLGTAVLGQFNLLLRAPVSLDTNAALAQDFQVSITDSSGVTQILVIQNALDVYAQPNP